MGLRRLDQRDAHFYVHYTISSSGEDQQVLEAVVLAKNNSSTLKLTSDNSDLRRWCTKLRKSPAEYLDQLCEALVSEDNNVAVFEVQDGHLTWKQYFPEQGIHGKRGKFKMEKVEYDEAVELVVAGAMRDLQESSHQVQKLTKETHENARGMEEALELASKSVQMKEDFEKEIYSKCAALINAKKLRIHQLRSTHPSSSGGLQESGRTSCLVRTSDDAGTSMRPTKKAKKQVKERPQTTGNYSDGYSSETDVDDPDDEDMDTDEERAISLSPVKPNKESEKAFTVRQGQGNGEEKGQATSKSKPGNADDSQELFNASLEAELYLPDTRMGKQCTTSSVSPVKPASQPPPQLTRSKVAEPVTSPTLPISPTLPMSNNDYDDDTQRSILNDLF